ncbi:MAG TPA: transposase [Candidatus Dormibacteraeota bacterium]|nr:transposase [Candidatus Dormibacteraeota bacterium]
MPQPFRKPNRLLPSAYRGLSAFFVTACTDSHRAYFRDLRIPQALIEIAAQQFSKFHFAVHAYCFMPDHCHFVLAARDNSCDLSDAMRAFKGAAAAQARKLGPTNLWQKGFYDHVIRSGEDFDAVTAYVLENPVRAGLVKHPFDWPLSGSLEFDWRKFQAPSHVFHPPWK